MAGVIGYCPPLASHCTYGADETIVGNVVTIDFVVQSDRAAWATLDETLITDGLAVGGVGSSSEFVGLVTLSLSAGVIGATASGEFGQIGCKADNFGIPFGPDTPVLVANCYQGGLILTSDVLIPVNMDINVSPGGFGRVILKATFFEMDTETGQTRPLAVQFQVPEPGSIVLCGIGLVGFLLRRGKTVKH